jgi:alpha-1,2-mannosyltransferase
MSKVRLLAQGAVPDFTSRPRLAVPQWLLFPGLILLLISSALYAIKVHFHPLCGCDLAAYQSIAQALRDGQPLYGVLFNGMRFTSPPVLAVLLLPVTFTTLATATKAFTIFGVVGTFLTLLLATRMLSYSGIAGRIGLAAGLTALMIWTEPFQTTFLDGQFNVLLLLLVLGDLTQSDRSRFKGVGIGVAAALKLIPALFVVYLLLTRRFRAAVTATATFVILTAVGWIVVPGGSTTYWLKGGLDSHNVLTDPRFKGEQALQGTVARLLDSTQQSGPVWILAIAVVGIGGFALATWAQRRGFEAIGVVTTAFVALLVSPTSWSHYWVWIAPLALVIVDVAIRSAGWVRTFAAGLALAAMVPFLSWDLNPPTLGPMGPVGLIWTIKWKSQLVETIALDAYVFTILALFVLTAVWLYLTRGEPAEAPPEDQPPGLAERSGLAGRPSPAPERVS